MFPQGRHPVRLFPFLLEQLSLFTWLQPGAHSLHLSLSDPPPFFALLFNSLLAKHKCNQISLLIGLEAEWGC